MSVCCTTPPAVVRDPDPDLAAMDAAGFAAEIEALRRSAYATISHITHRGYDRIPGIPARYTSQGFARGWRRFVDWFDWIVPTAWDYEHNICR